MPTERQPSRRDIRAQVKRAVRTWAATSEQRSALLQALQRERYPLHSQTRSRAGALSAVVFDLAGGTDSAARLAAAAIADIYMAASYILDNVMDEEALYGVSLGEESALGLGTFLVAESALEDAAHSLPPQQRIALITDARKLVMASCAGQWCGVHRQADPDAIAGMTTDEALALTRLKAGSIGDLCAVIGTGLAGALGSPISSDLRRYASHCFTYSQIVDDLSDAVSHGSRPSDITVNSPSLPSVFFAHSRRQLGVNPEAPKEWSVSTIESTPRVQAPSVNDLDESGATLFTQIVAETQRNRAIEIAKRIDRKYGGAGRLLEFLGVKSESSGRKKRNVPAHTGPVVST